MENRWKNYKFLWEGIVVERYHHWISWAPEKLLTLKKLTIFFWNGCKSTAIILSSALSLEEFLGGMYNLIQFQSFFTISILHWPCWKYQLCYVSGLLNNYIHRKNVLEKNLTNFLCITTPLFLNVKMLLILEKWTASGCSFIVCERNSEWLLIFFPGYSNNGKWFSTCHDAIS